MCGAALRAGCWRKALRLHACISNRVEIAFMVVKSSWGDGVSGVVEVSGCSWAAEVARQQGDAEVIHPKYSPRPSTTKHFKTFNIASQKESLKMTVIHIVLFEWKSSATSAQIQEVRHRSSQCSI